MVIIKANKCSHSINENILNRCVIIQSASVMRKIVESLFDLIYPSTLILLLMLILLILPFIFAHSSRSSLVKSQQLYNSVRFTLLSFFHRISYSYSLVPLLSYFIRQPSPCKCENYSSIKLFNNPYVYSFSSTIFGLTLIEYCNFFTHQNNSNINTTENTNNGNNSSKGSESDKRNTRRLILFFLGIIIIIVPSILYVLCGWASIGQAVFSVLFATLLYQYSSHTSNMVMLAESVILMLLNTIVIIYIEVTKRNYQVSLLENLFKGLVALIYEVFLVLRFVQKNNWTFFNVEKGKKMIINEQSQIRSSLLSGEQTNSFFSKISSDEIDGVLGIIFAVILTTVLRIITNK